MKLEGKKALVTGASRGIGRAIALALAAEGADVVVNYAGSEAAAKEVAAEIEAMGRKAFVVQADISSNEAATAMVDEVVKEFGRIDILINNAGITRDGLLMRMKEEDWDAVLTTNFEGCVQLHQGCYQIHDETKSRQNCQHQLCRWSDGQCWTG